MSILLFGLISASSSGQFHTDTTRSVNRVINSFLQSFDDISISNFSYKGNKNSIGFFGTSCKLFPINKGIIISTGDIWDAEGPNKTGSSGNNHYFAGDKELETLARGKTFDAAILEFDFRANSDSISFDYVFASEEYPEYANKGVNDVFAFFITNTEDQTKRNIALCNNRPITVNNINSESNKAFFIPNDPNTLNCMSNSLQYDGLTVRLSAGLKVKPYYRYRFKIGIADVGDGLFDSAVMLKGNSFSSVGNTNIPSVFHEVYENVKDQYQLLKVDSSGLFIVPNLLFDFNSYQLNDTFDIVLSRLSEVLKEYFDFSIEINGYADNIGSPEYNETLSLRRAQAIKDFLMKDNIQVNRVRALGLGSVDPLASNLTEEGRQKNRRVMIRIYKGLRTQ